ncbi:hypothetical protein HOG98_10315 [bacterium]|jgi:hypothetical protein|nr:hypothetical protein [Candidatus Woesearchaeota archaeon]MBT5955097.1 hypothetical protein [bacterium]
MMKSKEDAVLFYQESEPHSFTIGMLMVLFIVFLFGVFYVSLVFYDSTWSEEIVDKELSIKPSKQLTKLRVLESERLNQPIQWVDKESGIVRVPIQIAMSSIVKKYQK